MSNKVEESSKIEKIKNVILHGDLTTTEMSVFVFLVDRELTQSMIAEESKIPLNTLKRCVPPMKEKGLLIETRIEGRNIFLTSNLDYEAAKDQDQQRRRTQIREQSQDDDKVRIEFSRNHIVISNTGSREAKTYTISKEKLQEILSSVKLEIDQ